MRGELGVAVELCKQAVPVIANECIVRAFYFIRRLAMAMKEKCVSCLADMKKIDWNSVKPANTPTIARMLTVSTGVFTALDMGEAIATQKYWVSINYVGVGRFAVAIGSDVSWGLKARNVKKVRDVYENIKQQTFRKADADIYKRIGADMDCSDACIFCTVHHYLFYPSPFQADNTVQTTLLQEELIDTTVH